MSDNLNILVFPQKLQKEIYFRYSNAKSTECGKKILLEDNKTVPSIEIKIPPDRLDLKKCTLVASIMDHRDTKTLHYDGLFGPQCQDGVYINNDLSPVMTLDIRYIRGKNEDKDKILRDKIQALQASNLACYYQVGPIISTDKSVLRFDLFFHESDGIHHLLDSLCHSLTDIRKIKRITIEKLLKYNGKYEVIIANNSFDKNEEYFVEINSKSEKFSKKIATLKTKTRTKCFKQCGSFKFDFSDVVDASDVIITIHARNEEVKCDEFILRPSHLPFIKDTPISDDDNFKFIEDMDADVRSLIESMD